jgi:transcription antitermination factor NusG
MQQSTLHATPVKEIPVISPSVSWFVVYTKPQAEKKFSERLQNAGYEVYLPLQEELRQWSDRKKKIQKPLISSVVFVRCESKDLLGIYNVVGFSRILRYLGKPAVVQSQEIRNLQILLQQAAATELIEQNLAPGVAIEVLCGPFKGIIGTAVRVLNSLRVKIEIRHLGVAFGVNVPKSFVRVL